MNLKKIKKDNKTYGINRLHLSLPKDTKCSYGKVHKLCSENGLTRKRKKNKGITKADKTVLSSPDLINRDFKATAPNQKWLTDITEVAISTGKMYISPVFDCFDGAIVGLSISTRMKADLCKNALETAILRYAKPSGANLSELICHSDRGSQYTSNLYRETIEKRDLKQSMGRTGSCYDNARMESFFARLKDELINELNHKNMKFEELKLLVFTWVETVYNLTRINSANANHIPPLIKRKAYYDAIANSLDAS